MGTDTAPVMENVKLCRFHSKRDIFWISVTISEIRRYVSASVTGCWGSVSEPKWRIAILTIQSAIEVRAWVTNYIPLLPGM